MAAWHVNPKTGEPGRCEAQYSCPFGGSFGGHQGTKRAAGEMYEEFAAGVFDSSRRSLIYSLTDEESEAFSSGDCGRLAEAFHESEGYALVAVGISEDGGEDSWEHIAARMPDGRLIDVTGISPESDLREAWASHLGRRPSESIVLRELDAGERWEPLLNREPGSADFPELDPRELVEKIRGIYGEAGLKL